MRTTFEVSPAVNRLVRDNLISPSEIAANYGVTTSAVSQWIRRFPQLRELVVCEIGRRRSPLFWWPQIVPVLADLGLPHEAVAAAQKQRWAIPVRQGDPIGHEAEQEYERERET